MSKRVKALLDTTVFCGAILTNGPNASILRLARDKSTFIPIISDVCMLEFYRNASNGISDVAFSDREIQQFVHKVVEPLDETHSPNGGIVQSLYGRYPILTILKDGLPLSNALSELPLSTEQAMQIIQDANLQVPLSQYDSNDFHVWATALQHDCDYIVTSNVNRFPATLGRTTRIKPGQFLALF